MAENGNLGPASCGETTDSPHTLSRGTYLLMSKGDVGRAVLKHSPLEKVRQFPTAELQAGGFSVGDAVNISSCWGL